MKNGLRFAVLIRVSSEQQSKRGESLQTQRKNLEMNVEFLGGVIVKHYSGQEHATEGYERALMDQLLKDADAGMFDAVMVDDVSRWSRDTLKALEGFRRLRDNNIRFFIGPVEYDQSMPEPQFVLGIMSHTAQLYAQMFYHRSMTNKIERAKRGWPTNGMVPYGRRLINDGDRKSRDAAWEVVPEKQQMVERCYDLYVNKGLGLDKISKVVGMTNARVRSILLLQSGDTWRRSFRLRNEVVRVDTPIPPLLTKAQIEAVKRQAKLNPQFRESKYTYPLAHVVRCAECGATLHGQTQSDKYRYYAHDKDARDRHQCSGLRSVRAEWLEGSVFAQMGKMLSDSGHVMQAIRRVTAAGEEAKARLEGELRDYRKQQDKLVKKRERLLEAIMEGTVLKEEAASKLAELRQTLSGLDGAIADLEHQLLSYSAEIPEDVAERANRLLFAVTGMNGNALATWSDQEKAKAARYFFGDGNEKLGVFVSVVQHPQVGKFFDYEIRGVLGTAVGAVGRHNLVFLSDMAEERTATDVSLAELTKFLDSVDPAELPFTKDYRWLEKYKPSSPVSTLSKPRKGQCAGRPVHPCGEG
jgi:DNA invertase Pin-like site-specific DNA recombinase